MKWLAKTITILLLLLGGMESLPNHSGEVNGYYFDARPNLAIIAQTFGPNGLQTSSYVEKSQAFNDRNHLRGNTHFIIDQESVSFSERKAPYFAQKRLQQISLPESFFLADRAPPMYIIQFSELLPGI